MLNSLVTRARNGFVYHLHNSSLLLMQHAQHEHDKQLETLRREQHTDDTCKYPWAESIPTYVIRTIGNQVTIMGYGKSTSSQILWNKCSHNCLDVKVLYEKCYHLSALQWTGWSHSRHWENRDWLTRRLWSLSERGSFSQTRMSMQMILCSSACYMSRCVCVVCVVCVCV